MLEMLTDKIHLDRLKALGPAGYRLILRVRLTDSKKNMIDGMPPAWSALYNQRGYIMGDPVFLWGLVNNGAKRWEDIDINDYRGVLAKAKAFGLNYGVVVAQQIDGRHTALSVARSNSPYGDAEISSCVKLLNDILDSHYIHEQPKPNEVEILRLMSQGQSLEEIAVSLQIAISTVKKRLSRACTTLDAKTSVQAVAEAVRRQIV